MKPAYLILAIVLGAALSSSYHDPIVPVWMQRMSVRVMDNVVVVVFDKAP